MVRPIRAADLDPPRPAPRPANSVLDNAVLREAGLPLLRDHREPLAELVARLTSLTGVDYSPSSSRTAVDTVERDVVAADRRPVVARHPEPQRLGDLAPALVTETSVGLVAERAGHAERCRVVGERPGRRLFGAEAVEAEVQRRVPHLLAEAVPLVLATEPRTGLERPRDRELGRHEARRAHDRVADERGEDQVPLGRRRVGATTPPEAVAPAVRAPVARGRSTGWRTASSPGRGSPARRASRARSRARRRRTAT